METRVGVTVVVFREKDSNIQVLLGKRKGSHGEGEWAAQGGHLEYMESFENTALRELAEEVGPDFEVEDLRTVTIINMTEYAPKHYVDIGMMCWWVSGNPVVMEPDKCESWEWFNLDDLPSPRFACLDRILNCCCNNYVSVYDKDE